MDDIDMAIASGAYEESAKKRELDNLRNIAMDYRTIRSGLFKLRCKIKDNELSKEAQMDFIDALLSEAKNE